MSPPVRDPQLPDTRVAVLVEDEFEDVELIGPLETLRSAGAEVVIIGPVAGAAHHGSAGPRSSRTSPQDAPG